MQKKSKAFLFTVTALVCFLVIQPISFDVFAQYNRAHSNTNYEVALEDFSLYDFLLDIDTSIDILSIRYPEGELIGEDLQNKLINLLEVQDIEEAMELITTYSLSLLVKTPMTSYYGRNIPHTFSFNFTNPVNTSCRRGCGASISGDTRLSGTVTFNPDGTVIGHGSVPSFFTTVRAVGNTTGYPVRNESWWVSGNNNRLLEAHGQLDFRVYNWRSPLIFQCVNIGQICDFAPIRHIVRF